MALARNSLLKPPKIVTATLQVHHSHRHRCLWKEPMFSAGKQHPQRYHPNWRYRLLHHGLAFANTFAANTHVALVHCACFILGLRTYAYVERYTAVSPMRHIYKQSKRTEELIHCIRLINDCVAVNLDERCEHLLPVSDTLNLFHRPSSQLVAVGIMLCVPSL